MPKLVHEGELDITSIEDGGMAMIAEIVSDVTGPEFFRFQSWDTEKHHTGIKQFVRRTVRITIETLD